jgi:hypothetical protein
MAIVWSIPITAHNRVARPRRMNAPRAASRRSTAHPKGVKFGRTTFSTSQE